ncbi:hypothetical protein [Glycomyces harbinensis]|uniref:Immunity protein Imm1 n=1 Tax=Glycomyces harbinensis TaxID=58114 RepID=A0A1G7DYL6_9ACTN|nr:hypothetical protein [Glycomyces harbinensis]SDE56256.1 hypothetical protein SAMN05216270_13013 [Glycomyces harbinensis]
MGIAKFSLSEQFGVIAENVEPGKELLVAWLATDIGAQYQVCLDALAMIDDVSAGRPPFEEWDSEGYDVEFDESGLHLSAVYGNLGEASYPIAVARKAIEDHWTFIQGLGETPGAVRAFRPDLGAPVASLLLWEQGWERPHPYRGRLGLPATGPA